MKKLHYLFENKPYMTQEEFLETLKEKRIKPIQENMEKSQKFLMENAKNKFLSGIINENDYERLLQQIAVDFQDTLEYEKERDETYLLETRMHDVLGIPESEKVSSRYTSGAKLAKALIDKVGDERKVSEILTLAENTNKEDIVVRALKYMKHINESYGSIEETDFHE